MFERRTYASRGLQTGRRSGFVQEGCLKGCTPHSEHTKQLDHASTAAITYRHLLHCLKANHYRSRQRLGSHRSPQNPSFPQPQTQSTRPRSGCLPQQYSFLTKVVFSRDSHSRNIVGFVLVNHLPRLGSVLGFFSSILLFLTSCTTLRSLLNLSRLESPQFLQQLHCTYPFTFISCTELPSLPRLSRIGIL